MTVGAASCASSRGAKACATGKGWSGNCAKHCYDTWQYNCSTGAITHISVACHTSDPDGTGAWVWNGSAYQYIQKNGTCVVDGDCTPSGTPPSAPGDTSSCPQFYYFVICGGGADSSLGVTAAEAASFSGAFKYSDTCYSGLDGPHTTPPTVTVTHGDVSDKADCPTCEGGGGTPCTDCPYVCIKIFDDTNTLRCQTNLPLVPDVDFCEWGGAGVNSTLEECGDGEYTFWDLEFRTDPGGGGDRWQLDVFLPDGIERSVAIYTADNSHVPSGTYSDPVPGGVALPDGWYATVDCGTC